MQVAKCQMKKKTDIYCGMHFMSTLILIDSCSFVSFCFDIDNTVVVNVFFYLLAQEEYTT